MDIVIRCRVLGAPVGSGVTSLVTASWRQGHLGVPRERPGSKGRGWWYICLSTNTYLCNPAEQSPNIYSSRTGEHPTPPTWVRNQLWFWPHCLQLMWLDQFTLAFLSLRLIMCKIKIISRDLNIDIGTPMFTAAIFTMAKRWKQTKGPLRDKWIDKMWFIHTMGYYSAIKNDEVLKHTITWTNLETLC